jgi:hypothetical protein
MTWAEWNSIRPAAAQHARTEFGTGRDVSIVRKGFYSDQRELERGAGAWRAVFLGKFI